MTKRKSKPSKKTNPLSEGNAGVTTAANKTWWLVGLALLLLVVTRLAYQPALDNTFVDWDDQLYVTQNPMVLQAGKPGAPPVWGTPIALNYHPLTMETMVMDAKRSNIKAADPEAEAFISTNINLHAINAVLVFFFVWFLSKGNLFVSLFSGLLFALHPTHVESVAWVSERKDTLYVCFFLLACITYLRFIDQRKYGWLAATFVLFVLSCVSKAMAVSLVPVLFLLDWWRDRPLKSAAIWVEKLPFIAAALFFGLMAIDIQSGGNFHGMLQGIEGSKTATTAIDQFSIFQRGSLPLTAWSSTWSILWCLLTCRLFIHIRLRH